MKASRFVKAFEQEVDKWEKTLSQILEVVETLLQVQKQWMYLEVGKITAKYTLHNEILEGIMFSTGVCWYVCLLVCLSILYHNVVARILSTIFDVLIFSIHLDELLVMIIAKK